MHPTAEHPPLHFLIGGPPCPSSYGSKSPYTVRQAFWILGILWEPNIGAVLRVDTREPELNFHKNISFFLVQ